ncbi:hypothetical protein [Pedobacter sp. BMA]|uniref:hypothetical protein n=1 Tax=Pedobacter sp. BMA TaxID=1663685 RepID=UPI0006496CBA|nr:hypothetical protein [Pedobacter sp. BMA]KLT65555.1 hypothetical protein AB669_10805 [Pedobacter sp. BMA]
MKILITGGNNAKALKIMKAFPSHFVLLADYGEVAAISTAHYAFKSLGMLNMDSIAHILLNFCITEAIDAVLPLHHFEVEPLAKSSVLFDEYGIGVLTPPAEELNQYLLAEKNTFQNFAIFIKGECIFASGKEIFVKQSDEINGVFGYNDADEKLTLFTL